MVGPGDREAGERWRPWIVDGKNAFETRPWRCYVYIVQGFAMLFRFNRFVASTDLLTPSRVSP